MHCDLPRPAVCRLQALLVNVSEAFLMGYSPEPALLEAYRKVHRQAFGES